MSAKELFKKIGKNIIHNLNYKHTELLLRSVNYIKEEIINDNKKYCGKVHENMNVQNIIPNFSRKGISSKSEGLALKMKDIMKSERITVRIVYPSGTSWNSIGSIYNALIQDERYDVVIVVEKYAKFINILCEKNVRFICLDDYDIKQDEPDLLIATSYSCSPSEISFPGCKDFCKYIISAFPNVVINEPSESLHWHHVNNAYKYLQPSYYFMDKLLFDSAKRELGEKAIAMGNPQFDDLYDKMQTPIFYPDGWDKLKGKKVFLWATDHGLRDDFINQAVSVDIYMSEFFRYFSQNEDIGLIIRFHPNLIREMLTDNTFWSYEDYLKIKDYCEKSKNIVWDETADYSIAFKISDAMFIDVNCSFIISYLTTGKPICRLTRNDCNVSLIHPELKEAYSYAKCFSDCIHFIEDVNENRDEKKLQRDKAFESSLFFYDGKNGMRIKQFIDALF